MDDGKNKSLIQFHYQGFKIHSFYGIDVELPLQQSLQALEIQASTKNLQS